MLLTPSCDAAAPSVGDLYDLCRIDSACAARFYLPLANESTPYGYQLFQRLLSEHLLATTGSEGPAGAPDVGNATAQRWWWLALLRTARFCGGRANREFRLGVGCVLVDGRTDDDNVDGRSFTWECAPDSLKKTRANPNVIIRYVTIDVLVVLALLAIAYFAHTAGEQLQAVARALQDFIYRYKPAPPPVPPEIVVIGHTK